MNNTGWEGHVSNVIDALRTYILEEVAFDGSSESLDAQTLLVEEEILDSLGILEMVAFIERRFNVVIEPEDISIDNFKTLASIASLIAGKRSG